jgi:hypothetical protein
VRPRSPRPHVARAVGRELLARCRRTGGEALLSDKGYAARECAGVARQLDALIVCPRLFNMMGALQSARRRRHLSIPRIALVIRDRVGVSKRPSAGCPSCASARLEVRSLSDVSLFQNSPTWVTLGSSFGSCLPNELPRHFPAVLRSGVAASTPWSRRRWARARLAALRLRHPAVGVPCVSVVEHQGVAVRIAEERHVAHAGVEHRAIELHAARLEFRAGVSDVGHT